MNDLSSIESGLFGAVEAGGTKFNCAVGDLSGRILLKCRVTTGDPATTLAEVFEFFKSAQSRLGKLSAFGIATFGPVELNKEAPRYGFILSTPKPGWSNFDLLGAFSREFGRPVGFDTDVNSAGLAESLSARAVGLPSLAYVTVGTGIGVGIIREGVPLLGLTHPEIGHVHVRRHSLDAGFAGSCPFHGDCLEGLASGTAIVLRTGYELGELDKRAPIWEMEADYLGQLCALLVLTVSPHRVLLGGGVMEQAELLGPVRARMRHWLHGYGSHAAIEDDAFLAAPELGSQAGIKGALVLAMSAAKQSMASLATRA